MARLPGPPFSDIRDMSDTSPLEDWRGIDVGQIRRQLQLSVSERVQVMVDAANDMIRMQECASGCRTSGGSAEEPRATAPNGLIRRTGN
jgi:hypothetical protein